MRKSHKEVIGAFIDGTHKVAGNTKSTFNPVTRNMDLLLHGNRIATMSRSEEHTSELQSQSTISYAAFCLKKKNKINT